VGRAPTQARVSAALAPSIGLPVRFVVLGILALVAGLMFLLLRPDILATYHYNQYVLAVTHLFTLGWITSTIMGAMYQLVPVASETKLFSERLGKWQFTLHAVGVVGMVWMFWIWDVKQVGHFGSAVGLGIGLFVYMAFSVCWAW
jgi:cbb3-type cytochrome oxidase subunit 1